MIRIEKSIVIEAPVEEVFAYAADPRNLPEFWTGIVEVTDVQRLPTGGYNFMFVLRQAGQRFDMVAEDLEFVPNERVVLRTHGSGREARLTFSFERAGEATRVRLAHDYTILAPSLSKLGEPFIAKLYDSAHELTLASLKAHIEAGIPAEASR